MPNAHICAATEIFCAKGVHMSTKLIPIGGICAALLWGSTALAQTNNEPIHTRIPLGKAKAVLENNAAQQPQSQGLGNAQGRVEANQQRFIEKHVLSPADTAEPSAESAASNANGPEKAEGNAGLERPEMPSLARPERPERLELGRPERLDHPGRGNRK